MFVVSGLYLIFKMSVNVLNFVLRRPQLFMFDFGLAQNFLICKVTQFKSMESMIKKVYLKLDNRKSKLEGEVNEENSYLHSQWARFQKRQRLFYKWVLII